MTLATGEPDVDEGFQLAQRLLAVSSLGALSVKCHACSEPVYVNIQTRRGEVFPLVGFNFVANEMESDT